MNKYQTFEQFLTTSGSNIAIGEFVVSLLMAAFLAFVLSHIYVRFGSALSNRKRFGRNFILISMTTMLIISIVKASLALSLGLVGALSIVRFRTAVKEPEELAYMFLSIAIGLGLGANQQFITIVAFIVIIGIIFLKHLLSRQGDDQNLNLTIYSDSPQQIKLKQLIETLQKHCLLVNLKRFDENDESFEAHFLIKIKDFDKLNEAKEALKKLSSSIKISFLDNIGVF